MIIHILGSGFHNKGAELMLCACLQLKAAVLFVRLVDNDRHGIAGQG